MMRPRNTHTLRHEALTRQILGAFYDVHRDLGPGFLETVYRGAMSVRLAELGMPAFVEVPLEVYFHGHRVGWFRADLIVSKLVLVELKALPRLEREHDRQIINYLKASRYDVGLLLNFGPVPQVRRFVGPSAAAVGGSA